MKRAPPQDSPPEPRPFPNALSHHAFALVFRLAPVEAGGWVPGAAARAQLECRRARGSESALCDRRGDGFSRA